MDNQKIFITGATGFIGKHLGLELAKNNQVTALVRAPRIDNKDKDLLAGGIRVIYGDLLDNKTYASELKKSDYVFHLAALFKIDAAKKELYNANVLGTKALLEACDEKILKRFIFFSTAYVSAGKKERDNITEEAPYALDPRNWYEWSKAEAEKEVLKYSQEHKLPVTIIRPATVYGPGNFYGWYFIIKTIKDKKNFLSGAGANKIHFVCVYDVIKAAVYLAQKEETSGQIYNICDERPYSQKEAVIELLRAMRIRRPFFSLPKKLLRFCFKIPLISKFYYNVSPELLDFYIDNHTFSNEKLKNTGFTFSYPELKDGVEKTIRWYIESGVI